MASSKALASALTSVFNSSGRTFTPTDLDVYRDALADVADDVLAEAALRLVRSETWEFGRRPSPAMVLQWVHIVAAGLAAHAPRPREHPDLTPAAARSQRVVELRASSAAARREARKATG